jgi:hypothetical protein
MGFLSRTFGRKDEQPAAAPSLASLPPSLPTSVPELDVPTVHPPIAA